MTAEQLERLRGLAARASTDDELRQIVDGIRTLARKLRAERWEPYQWQHPHTHPPDWSSTLANPAPGDTVNPPVCDESCYALPAVPIATQGMWLQLGGRGTGKTEGASHYVNRHAEGPPCDTRIKGGHRIVIVAPTQGDAVEACVEGPSGLQTINPAVKLITRKGGTVVLWPNGARARLLGAHTPDDVNRLRAAGNTCLVWLEELAAMRYLEETLYHTGLGLRIGDNPHYVGSTTPQPRDEVIALMADPATIQTRGRTRDAVRLDPEVRRKLEDKHAHTTLGRQELDGEVLGDVVGALWVHERPELVDGEPNKDERPGIENDRVSPADYGWSSHNPDAPPSTAAHLMHRVIVGVDPPGGRTEAGIIVVGTIGNHGYVLADLSTAGPPDRWARIALDAYRDYGAEGIAAEHTYGGDMVTDVFATRDAAVPIFRVPTKVGKRLRAEPVQALYQQHRMHHVGILPGVEAEQRTWVPGEGESPNRIDALVHAATYLLIRARATSISSPARTAVAGRRIQRR